MCFEPEVGQLCSVFKIEIIELIMFFVNQEVVLADQDFLETSPGLNWLCIIFMTAKKCMVLRFYLILVAVLRLYDMKRVI